MHKPNKAPFTILGEGKPNLSHIEMVVTKAKPGSLWPQGCIMRRWIRLSNQILFQCLQGQSQAGATLHKVLSFCKYYRLHFQTSYVNALPHMHMSKYCVYIYIYVYLCVSGRSTSPTYSFSTLSVGKFSFFRP